MRRSTRTRRGIGKADGGSAWISYSDMMAALLLVFVLVLCYSVYQYFLMLETKTAELDEQSALLSAQQITLNVQQTTLDEQQAILSQQQKTLDSQKAELNSQQTALLAKENELTSALTKLDDQKALLDNQAITLEEQQKIIIAAQNTLNLKEAELEAANVELANKQQALTDATILLGQQQEAMDIQQQRLDDLVGVRTKIVRELTSALNAADLKASVDRKTGDIVLDQSAVFFETNESTIQEEGRIYLEKFVPVYLNVLLQPEYIDYVGEIIIEGHTDQKGEYLLNLKLSQERALSVATFCLQMPQLSHAQQNMLRDILTAKGRSFSDPVYLPDGTVDDTASRRVEFKFRMKDSEMIEDIRQMLNAYH